MSDEIMLVFGEDGVARKYDDAWDITIHCESEEEQRAVLEKLNNSNQEAKNSTESSLTQKALDTISRQSAIDALDVLCQEHRYRIPGKRETYSQYNEAWQDALDRAEGAIGNLPSAEAEPLSATYTKAVWTWLLDYQIKAAELKGRYTPYEVLSWVANDWRKEHERSD